MQQVPDWPTGPVKVPAAVVTVNNTPRAVEAVQVQASVSQSAVSARTGSVAWAPEAAVSRRQRSVLTPGVPRRGDRVTVDAGAGAALARLLTGKVDTTSGAVPGSLESDLLDDWDMLSTEVSIPSLTATMHPDVDEGPLRAIGLTATWPMQMALRQAGFYATPTGWPGGSVTASLNGSLWPEVGEVALSSDLPSFLPAPWGDGARGYDVTYLPGTRGFAHGDLQISLLVADIPSTSASFLSAAWPGGSIQVRVEPDRAVSGRITTGGVTASVLSLSAAQMAGTEHVVLRVSSAGVWRLVAGNGASVTATRSVPSDMRGVPSLWSINVSSTSQVIGGVNFGFASTAGIPTFRRTARLDSSDGSLAASRAVISRPAQEVLADRAKAEPCYMWVDGAGVFHWRSRRTWGTGAPVRTLTDVDLLGYQLGMDYDSLYSGATVSHLGAIVDVRAFSTITLYQGPRQTLNRGDREATVITVPDDEDWPAVDWSVDVLNLTGNLPAFNRGKRSWTGAVKVDGNGTSTWAAGPGVDLVSFTFETVNARTWIHTVTVSNSLPAADTVELRSPNVEDTDGVWPQWRDYSLPAIRGYARVTWTDRKTYGATDTTVILPRYEHDASWWVQGGAVQRLADWLATRYSSPVVTITGLSIAPDERIEIGDVVTLTDSTYADLTARAVVTGFTASHEDGAASMTIDVEVLSAESTRTTYAQVQDQADARTYAQFQALIGAVTYQQHEESL